MGPFGVLWSGHEEMQQHKLASSQDGRVEMIVLSSLYPVDIYCIVRIRSHQEMQQQGIAPCSMEEAISFGLFADLCGRFCVWKYKEGCQLLTERRRLDNGVS